MHNKLLSCQKPSDWQPLHRFLFNPQLLCMIYFVLNLSEAEDQNVPQCRVHKALKCFHADLHVMCVLGCLECQQSHCVGLSETEIAGSEYFYSQKRRSGLTNPLGPRPSRDGFSASFSVLVCKGQTSVR